MIVHLGVPCRPAMVGLICAAALAGAAGDPVAVRAEHFTVPPSTGPVTHVAVQNLRDRPWEGTVGLEVPAGWRLSAAERGVTLGPRELRRVPFAVERARDSTDNSYHVVVTAADGRARVIRRQTLVCSSAPYLKAAVDGDLAEWKGAIPVTYQTGKKRTTVSSGWNRRHLFLAVEVEEEKLVPYRTIPEGATFDAVQFALSPRDAVTGSSPADTAARYEFLIASASSLWSGDVCFLLIEPHTALAVTQQRRRLAPLALPGAQVVVRRAGGVTRYECAIPFAALPALTPREGREFCFSILVHDPDGTGVRDWGEAAGLWSWQRNRYAWCSWLGVAWGAEPPFDGKIEWGLCSSKT